MSIPLAELPSRMHELPPRRARVEVSGPEPSASEAVKFLCNNGREASLAPEWSYGDRVAARLWSPNPFLMDVASRLQPGRALDLACGSGRDAVALAANGWAVTAVDHLPEALEMGKDLERRYRPPDSPPIEWRCLDLESDQLPDLGSNFDLLTMFWYLNRSLIRAAAKLLAPGGSLVMETFTSVHREAFGKPRTESFVFRPGEPGELIRGLGAVQLMEDWHDGRHSARLWAIRR